MSFLKSRESVSSAVITEIALKAILAEFKELIHELRSDHSGNHLSQGNLIRPGEAAKRLGVSTRTLKRYRDIAVEYKKILNNSPTQYFGR